MNGLQAARIQMGWSRAELARRAAMNPATVGLIESGRLKPYAGQVAKLAQALGLCDSCLSDVLGEGAEDAMSALPEPTCASRDG
jgi:ribosome-binding protein aMBF1 (putative translation factor)